MTPSGHDAQPFTQAAMMRTSPAPLLSSPAEAPTALQRNALHAPWLRPVHVQPCFDSCCFAVLFSPVLMIWKASTDVCYMLIRPWKMVTSKSSHLEILSQSSQRRLPAQAHELSACQRADCIYHDAVRGQQPTGYAHQAAAATTLKCNGRTREHVGGGSYGAEVNIIRNRHLPCRDLQHLRSAAQHL